MKKFLTMLFFLSLLQFLPAQNFTGETKEQHDTRMQWWREARFGLFIHWGLYSIPAGQWDTVTTYGEWIRSQAQIPIEVYDSLVFKFNPVKFNAAEWVSMAKNAGMKYIVITSKHHDGFCLFNSKETDFDVMSTPFKRDILKELSDECHKQGMKLGFYYSIMDWHHPDYLPKRDWDKFSGNADFEKYIKYMKNQLKELLTNYGEISILWFDGEWESTWSDERGRDLYKYVRSLQPNILINNRVSSSRSGMEGFTAEGGFAGDFGTPEQQVPATGLPGVDWESCMTMNDHWGYNKNDHNWKSSKEIIRLLSDVASKGGNYLLNDGPTAEGIFPPESVSILREVGNWLKVNGDAIYGTSASPFKDLDWGRCTQKKMGHQTRLYLHIFDSPKGGRLVLPGIYNKPVDAFFLADKNKTPIKIERVENNLILNLGDKIQDERNTVAVLDIEGKPDINDPPIIKFDSDIFIDKIDISLESNRSNIEIHYTADGTDPNINSPLYKDKFELNNTATVKAACFRGGKAVSRISEASFKKIKPIPSLKIENTKNGIRYKYYEGKWELLPDFNSLKETEEGIIPNISLEPKKSPNYFGFVYSGYIKIPEDGIYSFYTASDDGSRLYIGDTLLVDNDGQHAVVEKEGNIALSQGFHPIRITFFENAGGEDLKVYFKRLGVEKEQVPDSSLFYD
ncbi:MAG TPA: alpha-L-fucosidase [Ignavibacteriaceae bacterium]|nr:alpha-L-fucosidase [Ignavibacteriaceae bacterium]